MRFFYRGLSGDGRSVRGVLDALDRKQALGVLVQGDIHVLSLREQSIREKKWKIWKNFEHKKIHLNLEEAERFFEKLFSLLSAKLTLAESVESMFNHPSNPREGRLLKHILQELKGGVPLSKALNKFCNSLSDSILGILDIGDVTGNLPHAVSNIIKILRRKIELKKRLIAGLSYPMLICTVSFGVIALFMFYLVPHVEGMMHNLGGELPWSTRLLVSCSHTIMRDSWMIFLLFAGCAIIVKWLYEYPSARLRMDRMLISMPLIGPAKMLYSRVDITSMIAGLLASGIDISYVMRLSSASIGNSFLKKKYSDSQAAIMEGIPVAHALKVNGIIDDLAYDILSTGEKTGHLDEGFTNVAAMYEQQLDNFLKKLVIGTSTVALLFAFSLVAILAIGMVSSVMNFSAGLPNK